MSNPKLDKFDTRVNALLAAGFHKTRVGMSSDKYAMMWHQIDSYTDAEFQELLS
jgi:hypothetical protein